MLPPESIPQFLHDVFTTSQGWKLILYGNAAGLVFAIAALAVSVVSFPLLLDRDVGAAVAIMTSMRAIAANPVPMAAWGLIVAVLLFVGSLPFFAGLAVVMPILGHATWHLYRKVIGRLTVATCSHPQTKAAGLRPPLAFQSMHHSGCRQRRSRISSYGRPWRRRDISSRSSPFRMSLSRRSRIWS